MRNLAIFFIFLTTTAYSQNLDSLFNILNTGRDGVDMGAVQLAIGETFLENNNYDTAFIYLIRSRRIFENSGDSLALAKLFIPLSKIFRSRDEHKQALRVVLRSLAIFEQAEDSALISKGHHLIGISNDYLGFHDKAIEHYNKALSGYKSAKNIDGTSAIMNNLAGIYGDDGDFDKSIELYKQTIAMDREIRDFDGLALTLGNLGITYRKEGHYAEAMEVLLESLKLCEENDLPIHTAFAYQNLGTLYHAMEHYTKAEEAMRKSLTMGTRYGNYQLIINNTENLYKLYKDRNNYQKALSYLERTQVLEDSIFDIENARLIHDMQAKYALESRERELQLKKAELSRRNLEILQGNTVKNSMIIGLIMLVIILILLYRNTTLKSRRHQLKEN